MDIIGAHNIPKDEPMVISGNHNNMFVDAAILVYAIQRDINFIMAAISAKNKFLQLFLKFANVILTERPRDHMYKGRGVIIKIDGELIEGEDTEFDKLKPGDVIKSRKNVEYTVVAPLSPKVVKIHPVPLPDSSFPIEYDIMPKMPQEQMFAQVFEKLGNDQVVAIFPEGGSHDQTELLPLKAGPCIFVYGTYKLHRKKVKMVEVGINYFGGHKFRSKVVINIGQPRSYDFEDDQLDNPGYKKQQIGQMVEDMKISLSQVKISAPTYNELVNLYMAKELYIPDKHQLEKDNDFLLFKKFTNAYYKIKDMPEVIELRSKVNLFRKSLKKIGLRMSELRNFEKTFGTKTRTYFKHFLWYLFIVSL